MVFTLAHIRVCVGVSAYMRVMPAPMRSRPYQAKPLVTSNEVATWLHLVRQAC